MKKLRMKTRDVAFQFRMGSGSPGDVNRTHPASIEPVLIDSNAPPTSYGIPVLVDATTQGVRPYAAGDGSLTTAYGIAVRPYPFQQSSGSNFGAATLGAATPPTSGAMDVLRSGYITAQLNVGQSAPVKDGTVYVRIAATSGASIQGQFETASDPGNNIALLNAKFQGGMDANSVAEVMFNI